MGLVSGCEAQPLWEHHRAQRGKANASEHVRACVCVHVHMHMLGSECVHTLHIIYVHTIKMTLCKHL